MSFGLENGRGAAYFVVFSGVFLVPWIFAPASAAVIPHARATTKTLKGGPFYCVPRDRRRSLHRWIWLANFFFFHDFYQFLIDQDDFFQKSAVGRRDHLDCGSIVRSGGQEVGNGVYGLLLDILVEVLHGGVVSGMVSRALGSLLRFA